MKKPHTAHPPVTIPTLVLDVHADGTLTATLDGTVVPPPTGTPEWRRESFGQIVDSLTNDRAEPIRIEVQETDGSVFTDILTPTRAALRDREDAQPHSPRRARRSVTAEGFAPGETVAVAPVLRTAHADANGIVEVRLTPAQRSSTLGEVVLIGHISGTTHIRRLP